MPSFAILNGPAKMTNISYQLYQFGDLGQKYTESPHCRPPYVYLVQRIYLGICIFDKKSNNIFLLQNKLLLFIFNAFCVFVNFYSNFQKFLLIHHKFYFPLLFCAIQGLFRPKAGTAAVKSGVLFDIFIYFPFHPIICFLSTLTT